MRKNRIMMKMVGKSKKLFIAKYLFLVLLVMCMMVVSTLLYISDTPKREDYGVVNYVSMSQPLFTQDMLDVNFEECFTSRFRNFETQQIKHKYKTSLLYPRNNCRTNNSESSQKVEIHPLMSTLLEFAELAEQFKLEVVLIDPEILFCMLSQTLKNLLLKRGFKRENKISKNVITLAVLHKQAVVFEKEYIQRNLTERNFQTEIVKSPILSWMTSSAYSNESMFISHVFWRKEKYTVHLVVFHERGNYLWHASLLSQSSLKHLSKDDLHFVKSDSAYDNFTAVSLGFKISCLKAIRIPSRPANFLHQIETSRHLECNRTINDNFKNASTTNVPSNHSSISVPNFNQRLLITLEEMKIKLDPLLLRFWIWSGTMLGWYRQCDVIPYTTDVDFAAWASDIDDLDELIKKFLKNEHLEIKQKMGMVNEGLEFNLNCHHLRVDLFFTYKEDNGTWYAGHCPKTGNYFKYHHPNFSLCSGELLGQKVLVPCQTEKVIVAEYGSDWMQPVSSWSYERSAKNKGPDIFWEKELLKEAYVDF